MSAPAIGVRRGALARIDRMSDRRFGVAALVPALLIVAVVVVPPILIAFGMSLFRIELLRDDLRPFVGLANFRRLLDDEVFLDTIPRTLYFAIGTVLITIPVGLATALVLNRRFRGSGLLGIALLLPWAVAPVVTGLFWNFIFNSRFGLATGIMTALGLTDGPILWLQDTQNAFAVAIVATAWRSVPLVTLLLLAARRAIPDNLYRAAKMDGASPAARFVHVTLPGIRNTLLVVTALQLIVALQSFDVLYLLTGGGPGRETTILSLHVYRRTVENLSFGYSAALAAVLFLIIAVVSLLPILFWDRGGRRVGRFRRRGERDGGDRARSFAARVGTLPRPRRRPRTAGQPTWTKRLVAPLPDRVVPVATNVAKIAGAAVLFVWLIGPIVWMVIASLQPEGAVTTAPPHLTLDLQFARYGSLLSDHDWLRSLVVSLQVTVCTTLIVIVLGAVAAYPLARFRMRGSRVLMAALIFTQMVPAIVLAIPLLLIFQEVGLKDSVLGLVIANTAFWLPVAIWLLRNVIEQVPRSLDAAARMDGCSRLGTLFRVTMPAARPGIAAAAILVLIGTWNEFLFAVVLGDRDAVTMTRRISQIQVIGSASGVPPFTLAAAAGILVALPCLLLTVAFHRRIVAGLTDSYVKG